MDILKYYTTHVLLAILLVIPCACTPVPKGSGEALIEAENALLEDFGDIPTPAPYMPASISALLRFVDLDPGGFVYAGIDASSGLPIASVQVESNDSRLPLGLEADGLLVAIDTEQRGKVPDQVELEWTPWHGNGRYVLNLQLLDRQNNTVPSSQVITVNVVGIPENVPTMKSMFIELYRDRFGLDLTTPVFTRYNAPDPTTDEKSRWVSTAYIGKRLYEIGVLENGDIISTSYPVNSDEGVGFCRPSGTIRMLAVIVDYGNTGLISTDVEAALQAGLEEAQQQWADTSHQNGLSAPILQVEMTTLVYGTPTQAGRYLTPDEIRSFSNLDPADFDLLAEIDLDKNNTATSKYGGMGVSFGGGCHPLGSERTNIAFNIRDQNSLEHALPDFLFEHEFIHSMGWMHWWPNQSGDGLSWVHSGTGWEPSRLFGWTDVDGDGVIEILDPTPYGLIH